MKSPISTEYPAPSTVGGFVERWYYAIDGWSNPRARTILDARGRSPMCGRVASPLLGRRSRGSLPRLPSVRKRSAVTGTLVGVRLQADQIKAIDAWAVKQNPPVTRPEAMLQILSKDQERSHPR